MEDSDYGEASDMSDYDDGSDAFEAPPIVAQDSLFHVLLPEDCEQRARAQVKDVCELLCCEPDVAQLLLRHFRWDRDKLTDGAPSSSSCCPPPLSVCVCLPSAVPVLDRLCACGRLHRETRAQTLSVSAMRTCI